MPSRELVTAFQRARAVHARAVDDLVPLPARMALDGVRDVLPDAARLEVRGELNEDWLHVLRIERAVGADGSVLFDVAVGHVDDAVESMIDNVNIEYLDPLFELTGDDFMGGHEIDATTGRFLAAR